MPIVREKSVLGGDPRIEGTRIGVHHVYELAIDSDHAPADVADQVDRARNPRPLGRGGIARHRPKRPQPQGLGGCNPSSGIATAGHQTAPQGVPGHVCGRPRPGYLGGGGHRSPCPEERNDDGRTPSRHAVQWDGTKAREHVQLNCRCRRTAPAHKVAAGSHNPLGRYASPAVYGGVGDLDCSLGEVHEALAYYYNHPDEMRETEREHVKTRDSLARRALAPPEPIE